MVAKGVAVQVKAEESSSIWLLILYNSLPFILILGISFFIMRQMQKNAGSGAMGFGKSRARMLTEKQGKVIFADVAGIDEAREELEEIVEDLKDPGKFARSTSQATRTKRRFWKTRPSSRSGACSVHSAPTTTDWLTNWIPYGRG